MDKEYLFKYVELLLNYIPIWFVVLVGLAIYLIRNPKILKKIPENISKAKFGDVEIELREVKTKLAAAKAEMVGLEAENLKLRSLYKPFDVNASVSDLAPARQQLKDIAGSLKEISVVFPGLAKGASKDEAFASAVILRKRQDIAAFDELVSAIDRISSDPKLEGLRYNTVWTLSSALHGTLIAAIRDHEVPKVSADQLKNAKIALTKMAENSHVQKDRPDEPDKGIRGPCRRALSWVEKGLVRHQQHP